MGESDPTGGNVDARAITALPLYPVPTQTTPGAWGATIGGAAVDYSDGFVNDPNRRINLAGTINSASWAPLNTLPPTTVAWRIKSANISPIAPATSFLLCPNQFGGIAVAPDGGIWTADAGLVAGGTPGGHLVRIAGNSPLMGGSWTTLQGGNRRTGAFNVTPEYVIAELGSYISSGAGIQQVYAVHPNGYSIGASQGYYNYPSSSYQRVPKVWSGTVPRALSGTALQPSTWFDTIAQALNSFGDVVGCWEGHNAPLVWENTLAANSLAVQLPVEPGSSLTRTTGINDSKTVVGFGTFSSSSKVYRWAKDSSGNWQFTGLSIPGGFPAEASGVTAAGSIFGRAKFDGSHWKGYYTLPNPIALLGAFQLGDFGGGQSEVTAASDYVGVAGRALDSGNRWESFLVRGTLDHQLTLGAGDQLPPLLPAGSANTSFAHGLNRSCVVVGETTDNSNNGVTHAFVWSPGRANLVDLQNYVIGTSLVLKSAVAVTDSGVIIGTGTSSGLPRNWIAYPVFKTN